MSNPDWKIPNDDITPSDIESGVDLEGVDLSGAELTGIDLSGAYLRFADLSEAELERADLSGTDLFKCDLSGANLRFANLSKAYLGRADLSGAYMVGTDLSGADLGHADLSGASLFEAYLSGAIMSRETRVGELGIAEARQIRNIETTYESGDAADIPGVWDMIARINHELKTAYSASGLVGRARTYRIRERRARRREALAEGGLAGYTAWLGSLLSRIVTGYGVQLRLIALLMIVIYLVSTAWYSVAGIEDSWYYSIVTFTTAPPSDPPAGTLTEAVAMIETFVGTLMIVLFGYVLGNREQV